MRVALHPASGPDVWLAGDPSKSEREHSSAANIRLSGRIQTQAVEKVRANNAGIFDRKNLIETLTFSTVRKFDTAAEAEDWSLTYNAAMPRTGDAILQTITPGGGVSTRTMGNVVVMPPTRVVTGCSVELNYEITGGPIA